MPTPHSAKAESIQELDEGCGIPAHPDDVVLVVKERMHALSVSQVVRVFPAALRHRLFRRPEPVGLHPAESMMRGQSSNFMQCCQEISPTITPTGAFNSWSSWTAMLTALAGR